MNNALKLILTILWVYISFAASYSQIVDVGLYNKSLLKSIVLSVRNDQYELTDSNTFSYNLKKNEVLWFSVKNDSILVFTENKMIGISKTAYLIPYSDNCTLSLKPTEPSLKRQLYDDGMKITSKWGVLQLINQTDIDKYVSGVVEAEGGPKATIEYYKSQALLCRTYCIQNLNKHLNDGFFLCDGTHCQAFNGRSANSEIIDATSETSGMVLTDADTVIVLAAFHASCGGHTESSGNIWGEEKSYLKPVKDPYCLGQNNANWTKTINRDEWIYYLKSKGFKINENIPASVLSASCPKRCKYFAINKQSIPFTSIRKDFNLRSANFSIKADDKNVTFNGHGFGHGVGLCQEGAMEMSRKGKNYIDIINFYYKNVFTFEIGLLNPVKNPNIQLFEK